MLEPLPPALVAVVLAWGSKFSEHPLLILDRQNNNGRSRLSRILVKKAQEVAEGERCYRLNTSESVLTCMIVEGIGSREYFVSVYMLETLLVSLIYSPIIQIQRQILTVSRPKSSTTIHVSHIFLFRHRIQHVLGQQCYSPDDGPSNKSSFSDNRNSGGRSRYPSILLVGCLFIRRNWVRIFETEANGVSGLYFKVA